LIIPEIEVGEIKIQEIEIRDIEIREIEVREIEFGILICNPIELISLKYLSIVLPKAGIPPFFH